MFFSPTGSALAASLFHANLHLQSEWTGGVRPFLTNPSVQLLKALILAYVFKMCGMRMNPYMRG